MLLEQAPISNEDRRRISDAQNLSLSVHFKQSDRPDGQPYVNHPLEVTLCLIKKFGVLDPDSIITALLHDSIEDQAENVIVFLGGKPPSSDNVKLEALELIKAHFGESASRMVAALTNPDFKEMAIDAQLRGDRSSEKDLENRFYKEHFLHILSHDEEAFLIKLADFSQNAFALGSLEMGPRQEKLRNKYGPVILATIEALGEITAPDNPLYRLKDSLVDELKMVYARDYAS